MNKLIILLKNNFINSFGINKLFKDKKGHNLPLLLTILVMIAGIIIFFLFGLYMYFYGGMFVKAGKSDGVLLLGITFGCLIIAISSISKTNSYLFASKDFDMLMALPIKTKIIFLSKVINLLAVNYVMFMYFYIPSVIAYAIFNTTNFLFWLFAIIGFFIIPLPIISVFGFISCQIGKIKISQNAKKVLSIILYLCLTIAIVFLAMQTTNGTDDEKVFFENMYNSLKNGNYLGYLLALGIRGETTNFVAICSGSLIIFLLFFYYTSKNYLFVNSNQKSNLNKQKKYEYKDSISRGKSSVKLALLRKEIYGYFSVPIYVVNTIIGPILSLVFTYFLISQSKAEYLKIGEKYIEMQMILPPLVILLMVFSISLSSTTSSSISLEGKRLWILKTLPVKEKDVFNAKVLVNLLITIPFIIINNIIFLLMKDFYLNVFQVVSSFILPILIVLIISKVGLYINILLPKLEYEQPAQVVKQSLSVLVTMLVATLLVLIILGSALITYALTKNMTTTYIATYVVCLLMYIIISLILQTSGKKNYNKIIC